MYALIGTFACCSEGYGTPRVVETAETFEEIQQAWRIHFDIKWDDWVVRPDFIGILGPRGLVNFFNEPMPEHSPKLIHGFFEFEEKKES